MSEIIEIEIAKEFTEFPGPRYKHQGKGSGQEFLENFLLPAFEKAKKTGKQVTIKLDGVKYGYPTSFLEEAFGGLARKYEIGKVLEILIFESTAEPMLDFEIRHYIKHARKTPGTSFRSEK